MKICPRCHLRYENQDNICPQDGVKLEVIPEEKTQLFDSLIGTVLEGRYKIISKLGQGGMGAVYKAEQIKMNRICAIKVIPEDMAQNGDAIERFNREAQMSALLNDPHAVMVYDFGETASGMYFLAMEYVEGETLSNLLKRERILPVERVCELVKQAGQALASAHSKNMVHRDLKPDNIMIAKKDDKDWVKVLDFGIAKLAIDDKHNDLTQTGMVIGTPLYMSPEQLAGEKLDPRSDIYSFAIITYQLLTGKLPFSGDNAQSIMVKRLTENPLPPSVANPQVFIPPNVEGAIMNALARNRNNRTPTIQKFVEQFEQTLRDLTNFKGKTSPNIAIPTSPQSSYPMPQQGQYPSGPQGTFINPPPVTPNPSNLPHPGTNPYQPIQNTPPNTFPNQNPAMGNTPRPFSTANTPNPFPNPNIPTGPTNPTPFPNPNLAGGMPGQQPTAFPPQMTPNQPMRPPIGFNQPTQMGQQMGMSNNPYAPPLPMQPGQGPYVPGQPMPLPQKKPYGKFWIFVAIFVFLFISGSCGMCLAILR